MYAAGTMDSFRLFFICFIDRYAEVWKLFFGNKVMFAFFALNFELLRSLKRLTSLRFMA